MKGIVVQFRRGRKTVKEKHFLLDIGLTERAEAKKYAGLDVVWKSSAGKEIKGKISDAHGNKGLVRAIFEKGLPGQAVTSEVEVKGELKEDKKAKKVEKKEEVNEEKAVEEKEVVKEEKKVEEKK